MTDNQKPPDKPLPVVYGYWRLSARATHQAATLAAKLSAYCAEHQYLLGGTFTDWCLSDKTLRRSGLAGLLDALSLPETYGALIPCETHLSSCCDLRADLRRRIARTGAVLIIMDDTLDAKGRKDNKDGTP
jgi:hypothetical protein